MTVIPPTKESVAKAIDDGINMLILGNDIQSWLLTMFFDKCIVYIVN